MMFDRKTIAGVLVGGMLGAAAVLAPVTAPVTAQETYSAEHLKNARDVMKALELFASFDQILPRMAEQARGLFMRNNPALAEEIEKATTKAALALIERRKDLDRTVINIWAARFSEEEIKTIATFFTSEAGKRFASQSGELLQESAVAAKQWGDTISVDIIEMVRKDLEANNKLAE